MQVPEAAYKQVRHKTSETQISLTSLDLRRPALILNDFPIVGCYLLEDCENVLVDYDPLSLKMKTE